MPSVPTGHVPKYFEENLLCAGLFCLEHRGYGANAPVAARIPGKRAVEWLA